MALTLLPIHLWSTSGVSPFAAARGVILTALIGLVLVLLCRAALRDRHLGGVAALVLGLALIVGGREPVAAVVVAVGLLLIVWIMSRRATLESAWIGTQLRRLVTVLALAVAIEGFWLGRADDAAVAIRNEVLAAPPPTSAEPSDPDIYLVLLDGYPRQDVLRGTFRIDDSAFLDGLRDRGFRVAANSHSNYQATIPSLASFLNYRHLNDLLQEDVAQSGGERLAAARRAINEAAVVEAFRARGYETIALCKRLRGLRGPIRRFVPRRRSDQ